MARLRGGSLIVAKNVFQARIKDQPSQYAYRLHVEIKKWIDRKYGRRLEEYLYAIRRPELLMEYRAAEADAKHLIEAFASIPKSVHTSRWAMLHRSKPIDYILGWTPFMDMNIVSRRPVLIPRRETEHWLTHLMAEVGRTTTTEGRLRVVDVGSGSGCISLALKRRFPSMMVTALDIAPSALRLTQLNASRQAIELDIRRLDVFHGAAEAIGPVDMLIANPPYVAASRRAFTIAPSVRRWESSRAVVGSGYLEGDQFHRRVLQWAATLERGILPRAVLEINGTRQQMDALLRYAADELALTVTRIICDPATNVPRAIFFY